MAFVSITKGLSRVGRTLGSGHPGLLTISLRHGNRTPEGDYWYEDRMLIRIDERLWREAEFVRGQKIELLFDKELNLARIVPTDHGYTLTKTTVRICDGRFNLQVTIPYLEGSGFPRYECQTGMLDPVVKDGGIEFSLPKATSFNGVSLGTSHKGKRRST